MEQTTEIAQATGKPVTWETLGEGPWQRVHLDIGKHYYCNTQTQESTWEMPKEVHACVL